MTGTNVGQTHVADLARLVGISFQNPDRQIFSGNVRAEVRFGPRNIGLRGADLDRRVDGALAQVGLTEVAGINPYDLGFSERKLLALASVIAMGTPAIVLDEPTTGQDANGVARVKRIVEELASEGRTVVAISHDMTFVAETFERVLVMRDGRLVLDAPVGEVFGETKLAVLESTYLEPPLAARLGVRLGLGATPTTAGFVSALSARDTIGAKRTGDGQAGRLEVIQRLLGAAVGALVAFIFLWLNHLDATAWATSGHRRRDRQLPVADRHGLVPRSTGQEPTRRQDAGGGGAPGGRSRTHQR